MVTTAFRNVYEFRFRCKGEMFEEHITLEEMVRFIASSFAPEEVSTLIGMLSSIDLEIETVVCHGDVIKDESRKGNKYICTSCGNTYRLKQKFCTFTMLKRKPTKPLVDLTKVQEMNKKTFKCETCRFPATTQVCPMDHQRCLRVKAPKKDASKFGHGCNTLEEYQKWEAKNAKTE